jgi:hypothetical protein
VSDDVKCAVCRRTILAGEQVHGYVAAEGRRAVCELCIAGAERLGWRPEGEVEVDEPVDPRQGRGGWARLLRRRANRPQPEEPAPAPAVIPGADPAAPGMRSRPPSTDASAPSPFERAATRFNASDAGRTVAGLARTLGPPWVSVGASAGAPGEVRITVAWELSWYQWGVDLGDELRPVFQLDKGAEVSQLDAAARQWNASLTEGGMVALCASTRPVEGQPARS